MALEVGGLQANAQKVHHLHLDCLLRQDFGGFRWDFDYHLECFDYLHHTAFHWAAKRNKIKAMKILLTYGKCVNLLDNNKMTPLHLAAQNNFYNAVQILCDNGANPLLKNIDGKKASELSSDFRIRSFLNSAEDLFPIGLKRGLNKNK